MIENCEKKGISAINNREAKRKAEKDRSGLGFETPPEYLKKEPLEEL